MIGKIGIVTAIGAALAAGSVATGEELLWEIPRPQATTYSTSYSVVYGGSFPADEEVADDFQATGLIERLDVPGGGCGNCSPFDVDGVYVRVYEWTSSGPGPLQHERFVEPGGGFSWDGVNPATLYISLDDPIPVDGWHFISVQVKFGDTAGYWNFEQNNRLNPINHPVQFRDNLSDGVWEQDSFFSTPINADFAISIFGQAGETQPVVAGVSRTTVTSSDRIIVTGEGFGAPGNGQLLVNGAEAIITKWSSTEIIGYVPEGVGAGAADLTVVNLGVESDPFTLNIVPRTADGRVRWVFEAANDYTSFPPAIAPNGNLYFDDIDGFLYAMTSDGALLWIVDALQGLQGNANEGPVAIDSAGTVYVGTNPLGPTVAISAFNPDGSHKWTYTAPHALTWLAGPNIGPDGRIYAAMSASQLIGGTYDVVALNPADGSVAWTTTTSPALFEDAARGFELVFGPSTPGGPIDQLLFTSDQYAVTTFGRLWSFSLDDGSLNFAETMNPAGPGTTLGNCQLAGNPATGAVYGFEFNGVGGGGYGLQAFDADGDRA